MRIRVIALLQLVLIFPAALFMAALAVRYLGPLKYEPVRAAQQIVMWYSGRGWTLRVLLFALPCLVLLSGFVALRGGNRGGEGLDAQRSFASSRPQWPLRVVSATTVISAAILAIVGFHVLTH